MCAFGAGIYKQNGLPGGSSGFILRFQRVYKMNEFLSPSLGRSSHLLVTNNAINAYLMVGIQDSVCTVCSRLNFYSSQNQAKNPLTEPL